MTHPDTRCENCKHTWAEHSRRSLYYDETYPCWDCPCPAFKPLAQEAKRPEYGVMYDGEGYHVAGDLKAAYKALQDKFGALDEEELDTILNPLHDRECNMSYDPRKTYCDCKVKSVRAALLAWAKGKRCLS